GLAQARQLHSYIGTIRLTPEDLAILRRLTWPQQADKCIAEQTPRIEIFGLHSQYLAQFVRSVIRTALRQQNHSEAAMRLDTLGAELDHFLQPARRHSQPPRFREIVQPVGRSRPSTPRARRSHPHWRDRHSGQ